MQLDMHYYGTYAMARSAGLTAEACKIIATAAQFVDDNPGTTVVEFKDAARLDLDATAHHALDFHNLEPEDQRHVWVPFHFFPGDVGEEYTERLVCGKNSKMAREMVRHNLDQSHKPFALELLGITAHVYADTFSHYGFSGVSSRKNMIVNGSIEFDGGLDPDVKDRISKKALAFAKKYKKEVGFLTNIKSLLGSISLGDGALGHGAVATFPDRPYLVWSFEYKQSGRRVTHNNPETFLEGCEALHHMFERFGRRRPDHVEAGVAKPFNRIRTRVEAILLKQGRKMERVEAWKKSMRLGELSNEVKHEIPEYVKNGREWHDQLEALDETDDSDPILDLPPFRFFQAAAAHRTYVMRDLMPQNGLVID